MRRGFYFVASKFGLGWYYDKKGIHTYNVVFVPNDLKSPPVQARSIQALRRKLIEYGFVEVDPKLMNVL